MPIYEYRCLDCGETVEILQRADEPAPPRCGGHCAEGGIGSGRLERVLSVTNIGHGGGGGAAFAEAPPSCGNCSGVPGSCAYEN